MKRLNEEVLRQLLLMNFDGSKTLLEQYELPKDVPSDRLGPKGEFQPSRTAPKIKPRPPIATSKLQFDIQQREKFTEDSAVAKKAYTVIADEIDGGWSPLRWKNTDNQSLMGNILTILVPASNLKLVWGTDEQAMTDAILSIKNLQQYDLLKQYLSQKYKDFTKTTTILGYIQEQEFSAAVNPEINDELRKMDMPGVNGIKAPLFPGQHYQFHTNDKFLRKMESHLQQFNPLEKYSISEDNSELAAIFPPMVAETLHILLPIGSIVISIIFPPTWLALGAAALLELGDAALYLKIDKDPYAAGLAAIFAFVPFGQLIILPALKKLGTEGIKRLLQKVISKEGGFIDDELKGLREIHENYEKLSKLAKLGMVQKLTLLTLRGLKTAKEFLSFTAKLIDKRLLAPNSLGQIGLTVGGAFITWDKIAAINGICNTAPLKGLKQSDWKILKGVGSAGKYLQPYSSPCDINKAAELLDKHNYLNIITSTLQNESDDGTVFNQDFNSTYNLPISLIQKLLIAGGFDKVLPKPQWSFNNLNKTISVRNGSAIKNIKVLSYPGSKVKKEITNADKKSDFTFIINGLTDAVYIMKFENYDGTSEVSKLFYLTKTDWAGFPQSSKIGNMKEGYYDKRTELAVSNYQKKNGLTDDGLAGPATIKSILSDYKSQKYGLTEKELNTWNLDAERVYRINDEFNAWKSDVESKRMSGMVNMEEVEKATKEKKEEMDKSKKELVEMMDWAAVANATEEDLNSSFKHR
jgi:peptidoglycan hydrolase-like protein with peptidoglycan-binding domain